MVAIKRPFHLVIYDRDGEIVRNSSFSTRERAEQALVAYVSEYWEQEGLDPAENTHDMTAVSYYFDNVPLEGAEIINNS